MGPDEFPDSLVDMAGPGADRSPFGDTANVVLRFVPAQGAAVAEVDGAIRRETLRVARDLAATTIDDETADVVRYAWPVPSGGGDLPALVAILQVASEGPLLDTYFMGQPMIGLEPTTFDPRSILDGALTNGAYDWAGVRNVTAAYQDSALLRALFEGHGERFRFAGLIVAPGYLDTAAQKQRSALASAELARSLGADGAICTTFSSGNSHTDTMLTVRACEQAGIATTALVCETNGGLTDHVPEADCLISTGNEDELVEPWSPRRGDRLPQRCAGRRARAHVGLRRRLHRDRRRDLDSGAGMTIVHYLNQFFAGLGGEEAAGHEPVRLDGPQGPGRAFAAAGVVPDVTLACGDDHFGEHERDALATLLALARGAPARRARLRPVVRVGTIRIRVRRAGARGRPPRDPGRGGDDTGFTRRHGCGGSRLHRPDRVQRGRHATRWCR